MTDSSSQQNCPKCGAPIPEEAPAGLCPKCVLGGAAAPTAGSAPTVVCGGRRVAPPSPEEIAPHFPDLEILEIIGAGGMGAVYKARQPKLDRLVAVKILTQDLAEDPSFVERFNREARVLAKLNHPHIVTVFDFGTAGPFCFLTMEFVDGVNLRQAMQTGGFTAADTLALIEDICEALKFAHEEGILHRDIKPENILIDSRGRVKIADFGIAKLVGDSEPNDITLTMHGAVLGSPQYMAPEQIETPGDIDQRADIYSLGVVFYELLTGELPLGRFAPPSEKAPMDARIDEIVMRTLEKEREARFQSAGEVETKIEAISQAGGIADQASGVAPQNPSASVSSSDYQPARFALTSAILTGSALLIAVVSVVIGLLVEEKSRFDPPPREALIVGGAILALLTGVPALLGMIFGFRALGEIRRSGGRKSGLGSALFGAMTAPSIAVVAATGGLLMSLLYATDTAIGSPYLIVLIVAIAGPLIAIGLIGRLARWARGEEPEEKPGMPGWRVALNLVLALILAAVAYTVFSAKPTGSAEEDTVFKEAELSMPANPYQELWDSHWSEGSPDFIGRLSVPPGHVAQVQLIEGGSRENATELFKIEAPDDSTYNGIIALGNPEGLRAKQNPGVAVLKATLWDQDGGDVQFYDKFFDGELDINTRETQIAMSSGPSDDIELGTLRVRIDPNRSYDNKLSKLYLRVTSAPREKAITAVDTPSVPPLKPGDIPGIEMAYAVPAGQIAVFALQAPWDKDHESPADWYVVAPDEADLKGRITFEITGEYGRGMETVRMVVATLLDDAGETLATHKFFAPDDHIVSLPPRYPVLEMGQVPDGEITGFAEQETPQAIDLEGKGVHMVVFGHRKDSQVVDSLRLLAWSVPRPEGADVGMWISHQLKRLNEKKWSNPIGDGTKSRIFDIEGDVRVRSGFLFDTRERVLKKQGEFQRTESLLVSKGARATIINAAGAKFRVGPQTEDTLIVPHFDNEWLLPSPDSGLTLQVDEWPRGEFTLAMLSPDAIVIREPAVFQLGGDGKLQVLEGEVTVRLGNGEETLLKSGQAFTMPKPDTAGNETP